MKVEKIDFFTELKKMKIPKVRPTFCASSKTWFFRFLRFFEKIVWKTEIWESAKSRCMTPEMQERIDFFLRNSESDEFYICKIMSVEDLDHNSCYK